MVVHWRFYPDNIPLQEEISQRWSISSLASRLLINREVRHSDEVGVLLNGSLESLSDPFTMGHMERAVERILQALRQQEPIVVYGDSDVDGVSGTALLTLFLRRVGGNVSTYIPNRLEEGYSLTDAGVAEIVRREARLVILGEGSLQGVE